MKMREILFRGKRVDTGEWVEGYYVNCTGRSCRKNLFDEWLMEQPKGD